MPTRQSFRRSATRLWQSGLRVWILKAILIFTRLSLSSRATKSVAKATRRATSSSARSITTRMKTMKRTEAKAMAKAMSSATALSATSTAMSMKTSKTLTSATLATRKTRVWRWYLPNYWCEVQGFIQSLAYTFFALDDFKSSLRQRRRQSSR